MTAVHGKGKARAVVGGARNRERSVRAGAGLTRFILCAWVLWHTAFWPDRYLWEYTVEEATETKTECETLADQRATFMFGLPDGRGEHKERGGNVVGLYEGRKMKVSWSFRCLPDTIDLRKLN